MERIDQLFDTLDRWRHLPGYQLERRADVLFSLYLPAFLTDQLGVQIRPELILEFPVRKGTVYPDLPKKEQNLSCKIDYIAMSSDGSQIWFVELKTDRLSRWDRQDDYLLRARNVGMPSLINGLLKIFASPRAPKNKYYHMLALAEAVGLLNLPPEFHRRIHTGWRGVARELAAARIPQDSPHISICYLQPEQKVSGEIGFNSLADWLGQFQDPLSKRFRQSLRMWASAPAGDARDL